MTTISGNLIPVTPDSTQENFNILYVGPPKSGKTHCAASWPNPLVLYCDKNLATLRKFEIPFVVIPDWEMFKNSVIPLLKAREWVDESGEKIPFPYRTIILDTATTLGDYCHAYHKPKLEGFKLWDKYLTEMMSMGRTLLSLSSPDGDSPSCNVVVCAHVRNKENDLGRITGTTLNFYGKTADLFPTLFDSVLFCTREVKKDKDVVVGVENYVSSVNPNKYVDFVGDGVGGGKYGELPPRVGGSYQELMKAWGVEDTP